MSQLQKKRKKNEGSNLSMLLLNERLPDDCKKTVQTHINTIYVESIIRICDSGYKPEGQLATVHWNTNEGLFVTLHNEGICNFVDLKFKSWVVYHGFVKPGAFKLFARYGTNDIQEEQRRLTINDKKKKITKF